MARMNWDRVRKEDQARRSGSEWVGSDGLGPGNVTESRPPLVNRPPLIKRVALGRSLVNRMPGCTCRKTVGFNGQHKKFCPLRNRPKLNAHPQTHSEPVLTEYPERIKRQLSAVGDFLSSLQGQMNADDGIAESHQKNIRRLIQVLQDELLGTSNEESAAVSDTPC